ncbi:Mu-like prophage major head subunit gpT family protein [Frigidibacter oleivorans]|uniref:Mu-like prophage major head subunit gpT family protein n=1 Tax=Frigidibacter oleivorans TaxID=2487129 RepID=UPI000F8DDF89|nr:Mu-like prophage major head subunit gpT family protein [Frigidibacter oleivorans]
MKLTSAALDALRVGFKAHFQQAFDAEAGKADYAKIAELVTSSAGEEKYGWLGELPGMREWIGPRVVHGLAEHDYAIKNKDFELTVAVSKNHIEDDTLGTYGTRFKTLGRAAARHPNQLVFGALAAGFATECYDGQFFFDTDHPVLNEAGVPVSVANTDGGSGTPWFLLATSEIIKPIFLQTRKQDEFVSKDNVTDDNVFMKKEFVYGVDARRNVGYGMWQMAWGSKQTLDADHYATARAALGGMKGDFGSPLGIKPNLLVVPRSLEAQALELLNAERNAAGATNVWRNTAELFICDWL